MIPPGRSAIAAHSARRHPSGLACPSRTALDARVDHRLPAPVEVTAYYVVSEALTNVAKHANASRAQVTVDEHDCQLRLSISDDGVGGADASGGSGLVGLKDRVEVGGGTLTVESRAGDGTRLAVALPAHASEPAVSA